MSDLTPGWFKQQVALAEGDVSKWPDWLKTSYEAAKASERSEHVQLRSELNVSGQPVECASLLKKIGDLFHIGSAARSEQTILTNIKNAARRSECLSRIEHFLSVLTVDEEDGEEYEETVLNWGSDPDDYIKQFKYAWETRPKRESAQPVQYGYDPGTRDGDIPALTFRKGKEITAILTGDDARVVAAFIKDLAEASPERESVKEAIKGLAANIRADLNISAFEGATPSYCDGLSHAADVVDSCEKIALQQIEDQRK